MKTIIIGAGISGLSTAFHLGKDYRIIEKTSVAGGLTRSVKKGGFTFDISGHLLHTHTPYAGQLVKRLLGKNISTVYRNSWIYSYGAATRYPYQANLYGLPPKVAKDCITGFVDSILKYGIETRRSGPEPGTFKSWVMETFGAGFGKHFFFPYNKKLWTVPADVLTSDWTGKFVPRPSLCDIVYGAINDIKKAHGYNVSFFYPRTGGIQALTDTFVSKVSNLSFNSPVMAIDWKKKRLETSNYVFDYENIVSTMPLYALLDSMKDLPRQILQAREKLKWNSVLCLNLGFNRGGIGSDRHWYYFPENKYPFYRAGFYHNFSKSLAPRGASSMYVEISRPSGTRFNYKAMLSDTLRGLEQSGIIRKGEKPSVADLVPIECAYVIYDKYRHSAVKTILEFLSKIDIFSIGRYGSWKYSYIEESILEGREAANRC